jgi:hypothetical protein
MSAESSDRPANGSRAAANGSAGRGRGSRPGHASGGVQLIAPSASPEEAAAIVAALERFMRATAPGPAAPAGSVDAWWRAGILEGTERDAPGQLREPWMSA